MSLDPYIVIEYIKSSVDIILNLKFEEIEKRLMDKTIVDNNSGDIESKKNDKERTKGRKILGHHNAKN